MHETDSLSKAIERVQAEIIALEQKLAEHKRTVNTLCGLTGRAPLYANAEPSGTSLSIRSDEFYGKRLATAVRSILEKRAAAGLGAASVEEIYDALLQGGFKFPNSSNDVNARRSLATSLGKNTVTFHKVPNGNFGLLEWYPAVKAPKKEPAEGDTDLDADEDDAYPNDFADGRPAEATASPTAQQETLEPARTKRSARKQDEVNGPLMEDLMAQ